IGLGDARLDRHADPDLIGRHAFDAAHQPRALGEIDQRDVAVAALLRAIAHDGGRIDGAGAARRVPAQIGRAAMRAERARRKDLLAAAGGADLQCELPSREVGAIDGIGSGSREIVPRLVVHDNSTHLSRKGNGSKDIVANPITLALDAACVNGVRPVRRGARVKRSRPQSPLPSGSGRGLLHDNGIVRGTAANRVFAGLCKVHLFYAELDRLDGTGVREDKYAPVTSDRAKNRVAASQLSGAAYYRW